MKMQHDSWRCIAWLFCGSLAAFFCYCAAIVMEGLSDESSARAHKRASRLSVARGGSPRQEVAMDDSGRKPSHQTDLYRAYRLFMEDLRREMLLALPRAKDREVYAQIHSPMSLNEFVRSISRMNTEERDEFESRIRHGVSHALRTWARDEASKLFEGTLY
jgi:hypothetical protein